MKRETMVHVKCLGIGALLLLALGACTASPLPDAGLPLPAASHTVHVPVTGCTVVVLDQPDGRELNLCLSASDLQPIVQARTEAGRQ